MEEKMIKSNILCKFMILSAVVILIGGMSLSAVAQTDKGIELYNSWEYEKAEKALRNTLIKTPDDSQTIYYLGLSLLMQAKYQDALDVITQARDYLDKGSISKDKATVTKGKLEIALARVYLGLKKYPEALECLNAAEKTKADPADVHTFRGAYLLKEGSVNDAVQELKKAIDLDSHNPYTYYYAGLAYLRIGNPSRAVQLLETFLQLAPYAPEAHDAKIIINSLC